MKTNMSPNPPKTAATTSLTETTGATELQENFVQLTEDEFYGQYGPLIRNHINENAGWNCADASEDDSGCMFETYGPEVEFVRQQDPRTIWTLVDYGQGGEIILSGYHWVNRIGYFLSRVRLPEGVSVEVCLEQGESVDDEKK